MQIYPIIPQDLRKVATGVEFAGLTITGCAVFGLNSAVFKPIVDSADFFQVRDAAGASLFNVDTINGICRMKSPADGTPTIILFDRFPNDEHGDMNEIWFSFADDGTSKWYFGMNDTLGAPHYAFQIGNDTTEASAFVRFYQSGIWHLLRTPVAYGNITPDDLGNWDNYQFIIKGETSTGKTAGILFTTTIDEYGGSAIIHYDNGGGGKGDLVFYTKQSVGAVPPIEVMRLTELGYVVISGNLITLNDTHEDTDGGGETSWTGKRQDGAGTETSAAKIEISHDGSGANDQLGKIIAYVNTGAGLVQALEIGSDLLATFAGTLKSDSGRILKTNRLTGNTTLDATYHQVFCDTDGGAFTITLPAGVAGTEHRIINTGSSSNNLTIAPDGAELLIGVNANWTLMDGEALAIVYEATEGWF